MVKTEFEVACSQVVSRFFRFLDKQEYERLTQLFTAGGHWRNSLGLELTGHGDIMAYLQSRQSDVSTCHVATSCVVDVLSDTEAVGTSYATAYRFTEGERKDGVFPLGVPDVLVEYEDQFEIDEGVCRIKRRISKPLARKFSR